MKERDEGRVREDMAAEGWGREVLPGTEERQVGRENVSKGPVEMELVESGYYYTGVYLT